MANECQVDRLSSRLCLRTTRERSGAHVDASDGWQPSLRHRFTHWCMCHSNSSLGGMSGTRRLGFFPQRSSASSTRPCNSASSSSWRVKMMTTSRAKGRTCRGEEVRSGSMNCRSKLRQTGCKPTGIKPSSRLSNRVAHGSASTRPLRDMTKVAHGSRKILRRTACNCRWQRQYRWDSH